MRSTGGGLAGHLCAGLPIDVNRLDGFEAHDHGPVHRRARPADDPGHLKQLIVVFRERGQPMQDDNRTADRVAQRCGDLGPDHGVVEIVQTMAMSDLQRPAAAILVVFEKRGCRPHDPELPVTVAEGYGHDPVRFLSVGDVLIAFPRDVVGGVADPENGIEQQLYRP